MVGVRSKDHEDKRRLILDTAANLFARQGFTKTSVSEISTACNASKAWIYHYFPTKEDILFVLLRDFVIEIDRRVNAMTASTTTPHQKLRQFVVESLQIYDEYRINYPILFNEMIFLPEQQQRELRAIEARPVKLLESILANVRPELRGALALRSPVTLLVYGTINGTYTWFNPDGRLSTHHLADLIVDFVLNGLTSLKLDAGTAAPER